MNQREAAEFALDELRKAGAERSQVIASASEKQELNVEAGEVFLYRTLINQNLSLRAIRGGKQGSTRVNKLDQSSIESAVQEVMQILEAASADSAYDIAPLQTTRSFEHGPLRPDRESMHQRLTEMLAETKKLFPLTILEGVHLDHVHSQLSLLNSNGVDFQAQEGHYGFTAMFTSKEGAKASSFNYTGGSLLSLNRALLDTFGLADLLRQSVEHIHPKSVSEKFSGELILTPYSLPSMLGSYLGYLSDSSLIGGTSLFKDKLGQRVASPLFSVRSDPRGAAMATHEFFDAEGFESQPFEIFSEGVLKSFLLSQYGSRKTGKEKAKSGGGHLVVRSGATPFSEMLRGLKRGILLGRFSGGRPSENGDFSGVAKNSYYVEDGKILYPVSETMISGNLSQLFAGISHVSQESVNFGNSIYPYLLAPGVTISGK
jgi:PmbA protein